MKMQQKKTPEGDFFWKEIHFLCGEPPRLWLKIICPTPSITGDLKMTVQFKIKKIWTFYQWKNDKCN